MNLVIHVIFLGVLLAATAFEVDGSVCYPGQEPGRDSTGLMWSLTTTDPTDECTAYRLGGFNTRPPRTRIKRTTIGGDHQALNLKPVEKGQNDIGETSPCAVLQVWGTGTFDTYPQSPVNSSFDQFSFALVTKPSTDEVHFRFKDAYGDVVYEVALTAQRTSVSHIYHSAEEYVEGAGADFPGRFWVNYDDGEFNLTRNGSNVTLLHYEHSPNYRHDIWSTELLLKSGGNVVWQIYTPCV